MEAEEKLNRKAQEWIDDNVTDDIEDNMEVGQLAEKAVLQKLNIALKFPEIALAIYGITFSTIIEKLKEKRDSDKKECSIQIADIIEIGWDNQEDDGESEKVGNFCPYILDLSGDKDVDIEFNDSDSLESIERCVEWNTKYIKKNTTFFNDVAASALKSLAEIADINLFKPEVVFPIFTITHKQLVERMKLNLADKKEEEQRINFCNCFEIIARAEEDGISVGFQAIPTTKLQVKSDSGTTAVHE